MTHSIIQRASGALLALVLLFSAASGGMAAKATPAKVEVKTGVTMLANEKASIDASNLAEGFVMVKYTGGKKVKIKVQIAKTGGTTYTYNLNNAGTVETFPLTEGDGAYSIKVFENTTGTKYAQAYSTSVTLKLRSEFAPYLYSNQYVNFTSSSKVVAKAATLVKGKTTDLEKIKAIYDFAVKNITYDTALAKKVQEGDMTGYLPVVDKVLDSKKGICFDYAAVMTAMLRSQGVPCKLIIGYAGTTYHAWINTFVEGTGWVDSVIYFDGDKWTLMDPTFVSSGGGSKEIMKFVTTPANYVQKFAY